jgi:secondary thiamine-phosphate synthase enzyme
MHRLDGEIDAVVSRSGIRSGVVNVFHVGSTGAIVMIEFEPGLQHDLPEILNRLIPPGRHYGHEQAWHDGNAHSHLQASILGPSLSVPIREGKLETGTWQQIIHLECDNKPRQRRVAVTVVGQ